MVTCRAIALRTLVAEGQEYDDIDLTMRTIKKKIAKRGDEVDIVEVYTREGMALITTDDGEDAIVDVRDLKLKECRVEKKRGR